MVDKDKSQSGEKSEEFRFEDTDSLKAQVMAALEKKKVAQSASENVKPRPKNSAPQHNSEQQTPGVANRKFVKPASQDQNRFSKRIEQRLQEERAQANAQGTDEPVFTKRSGSAVVGKTAKVTASANKSNVAKRPRAVPKTSTQAKQNAPRINEQGRPVFDEVKALPVDASQSANNNKTSRVTPVASGTQSATYGLANNSGNSRQSQVTSGQTTRETYHPGVAGTSNSNPSGNMNRGQVGTPPNGSTPANSSPLQGHDQIQGRPQQVTQPGLGQGAQQTSNAQQHANTPQSSNVPQASSQSANPQQNPHAQATSAPQLAPKQATAAHKQKKKQKESLKDFLEEVETLPEEMRRKEMRKKENSLVHKIVMILLLVFVVIALIVGFSLWNFWESGQKPLSTTDSKTELVEIPLGSSNKQIGGILEKEKIIKSAVVFNYYMKLNNQSGFQAGFYELAPNMTLDKIAKKLKDGESVKQVVAIPEGYSADQIAAAVEEKTPYTAKEFLAVLKDDQFFAEMLKKYPKLLTDASKSTNERYKLEGYLFPATYTLTPGSDVEGLVTQMVQKADSVMSQYYDVAAAANLNVHEVMTLASLVEKEGVKDEDRRNIAKVFLNRLAIDMPLQSDISILYAMDEHKVTLTVEDTKIDSPYNLYVNKGYGPGPFDSPSENAIKAVLYPADNSYYYFVADVDTGTVYFAQTFEEHSALVDQYVNKK